MESDSHIHGKLSTLLSEMVVYNSKREALSRTAVTWEGDCYRTSQSLVAFIAGTSIQESDHNILERISGNSKGKQSGEVILVVVNERKCGVLQTKRPRISVWLSQIVMQPEAWEYLWPYYFSFVKWDSKLPTPLTSTHRGRLC